MFNVDACIIGRTILVAMAVLVLNACVYGVPIVDPLLAVLAVDTAVAQSNEGKPIETKIRGTYESGFWFDRDLFSVYVHSHSSEEARRVAHLTAMDTCSKRDKPVKIIDIHDSKDPKWFAKLAKVNGFYYEMKFRCEEVQANSH